MFSLGCIVVISVFGEIGLANKHANEEPIRGVVPGRAPYERLRVVCRVSVNSVQTRTENSHVPGESISFARPLLGQVGNTSSRGASRNFPALHSSVLRASRTTCSFSVACMLHVE